MSTYNSFHNEFKYCPICQLPLQAINISPISHASHCLSSWDGSGLEECPDGANCLNTNIFHYRDYCHTELAKYRSSSAYVEPEMAIIPSPKKQGRPSPKKQGRPSPKKEGRPSPKKEGRPSPKKEGRPSPMKRPKMSPAKSITITQTHKTKPVSSSVSDPYYSSDSDSDFILPRKRPSKLLKYSDSDSSVSISNKKKRTSKNNNTSRTAKSVSEAKSVKNDVSDWSNLCGLGLSNSVDSQETVLQKPPLTSDSFQDEGLPSEMNLMCSDVSDLFSDDETNLSTDSSKVSLKESNTEVSKHNAQCSAITNTVSETIVHKSVPVVLDKNIEGSSYKKSELNISSEFSDKLQSKSSATSNTNKPTASSEDKSEWKALLRRMRDRNMPSDLKVDTDDSLTPASSYSSSASSETGRKQCPFYRRIPGTPFVVDAFQYGDIPDAKVYFLSHFHSDHYIGLRKNFSHPIYCSQITANLVRMKIRVEERWLNVLTEHEAQVICGVEVTALDANHCPGSQMYLFRLKNGCNYLHVGDFRASPAMCSYPELKHIIISKLFLDTTYCSKQYTFPTQEDIIARVVKLVRDQAAKYHKLLVVCGSYLIGKEKVFLGIAEALDWKVWVRSDKRRIFECLNDPRINSRLAVQGYDANVHVLPMNHINHKSLKEHAATFKVFTHVIGIKPTGWELNAKSDEFKAVTRDNCTVYGVAYSEHSSYSELRSFVQYIRPEQIIPTVNVGNPASRNKMTKCFQEWMRQNGGPSQNTVSRYFNSAK